MTYPSQRQVQYSYDAADRLSAVTRGAVSVSIPKYLATGVPEEMVYGNGVKETWALTKRLQVDSIAVTRGVSSLLTLNYGYGTGIENNGNVRTQTIRAGGHTFVQSYGYDPVNRLSQASETTTVAGATGWSIGFEYDRYGNMAAKDWTLVVPTAMATSLAQYNGPLNRRDRTVSGVAMSPNPYDKAGNLISDAALGTMQYDQAGRLRRTQVLGKTVNYDYDAEGRRVRRDLPGLGTTYYVYDGSGQLAAEYGASEPSGCSLCYLTADMLGSTRLVTDGAGGVNQRMDYLPFGDIVTASLTQGGGRNVITDGTAQTTYALASAPTQRFTGKERDEGTGLDNFLARYYSAPVGRFTSPDVPFADQYVYDPQSWNLYSYARSSPLVNVDQTGRSCIKVQTVNPDGSTSDSFADDGDGKGCAAAGIKPNSQGGLNASAQQLNVYGGPDAAQQEVSDALRAFVGEGPKRIEYGPEDPFTKSFQDSIGMQAILAGVKRDCRQDNGRVFVGTGEAFVNALIDGVLGGRGFYNPNAQLGAFRADYQRSNGSLNVTVTNPISLNSAAYHATSKVGIANPTSGPLGTVNQTLRIRADDPCVAQ